MDAKSEMRETLSTEGSRDDRGDKQTVTLPPVSKTKPGVKAPLFQAWSAFGAGDAGETDLREGEIVVVLDVTGTGWWQVKSEAGIGWVPDHFLRPVPSEETHDLTGNTEPLVFYGKDKDFLKPKLPHHSKEKPKRAGHVANRFLNQFKVDDGNTTNISVRVESDESPPTTPSKRTVKDLLSKFDQT